MITSVSCREDASVTCDSFEPIRREVRSMQALLRRREDEFHELQRQTIDEFGYMPLHGPYNAIVEIEREIVRLRMKMPPFVVKRDGYYQQIPVEQPINPREEI